METDTPEQKYSSGSDLVTLVATWFFFSLFFFWKAYSGAHPCDQVPFINVGLGSYGKILNKTSSQQVGRLLFQPSVAGFKSHKPGSVRHNKEFLERGTKAGMCKEKNDTIVCGWLQSAESC